jgi:hypothetical protein
MKRYKLGLFGELISESKINSIVEQGGSFDFEAAAKSTSSGGSSSGSGTSTVKSGSKGPERAKEKTKIVTKVENYKDVAIAVDKHFTEIYTDISKLYDPKDNMYNLFYSYRGSWIQGGDNEEKALKELFGTSTIAGSSVYDDYFLGGKSAGSKFWGVYVLPNLNKILKYKKDVQKTGESINWNWEIEEDGDFWALLEKNIEQLWTVFKDIIYKTMRYYDRTMYNVTYRPTLSAYSDNAKLSTYSFNLDF